MGMQHELHTIYDLIQQQDLAHQSFCTGSGFLVKRQALKEIGGFPERSLQEDVLTSIILADAGWKTLYVPGQFQWGLAPDTLIGWIRQRQRWSAGILSVAQYLASDIGRNLDLQARIGAAAWGIIDTLSAVNWTVAMITLPLIALYAGPCLIPVHHLKSLYRLAFLDFILQSVYFVCLTSLNEFRSELRADISAIWTTPYRLATALRFYALPNLLGYSVPLFQPTGKLTELSLEEHAMRQRGRSCLPLVLFAYGGWFFLLIFVACLAAPLKIIGEGLECRDVSGLAKCIVKLSGSLFYPPIFYLWMVITKNVWIPLSYGIAPPPSVPREHLLARTGESGNAHPKDQVKRDYMQRASQIFWLTVLGYYMIALAATEIYLP